MEKKDLIQIIKNTGSTVDLYKYKEDIVTSLGKSSLSKKLSNMKSVVDFYAEKDNILLDLENIEPFKKDKRVDING